MRFAPGSEFNILIAKDYIEDEFMSYEHLYFPDPPFGDTLQFKSAHFAQWEQMTAEQRSVLSNPKNFQGQEFPLMVRRVLRS